MEFSLLDIAELSPLELSNKIFTYDSKIKNNDLSKVNEIGSPEIE